MTLRSPIQRQTLRELQAEWRDGPMKVADLNLTAAEMRFKLADELTPFISSIEADVERYRKALENLIQFTASGIYLNDDGSPKTEWDYNAIAECREATESLTGSTTQGGDR